MLTQSFWAEIRKSRGEEKEKEEKKITPTLAPPSVPLPSGASKVV